MWHPCHNFATFLKLFGQRELMRATLSHFLSKMGLKRPGGPSSEVTQFPPSSDSSLPESLRVLTEMHLQLLDEPELSGISKDRKARQCSPV